MSDVLIVDDEPALRRLVRRWIERSGIQVVEADSAEQALLAVANTSPKVAFCDVELGTDQDGFWLAGELNRRCPTTVVVMMTSEAQVDAVVAGVRAGSRVYLVKPVSPNQLHDTLKASLEEHATRVREGISTRRAPHGEGHIDDIATTPGPGPNVTE
jgi:DNA-binding NtrC family response regulator